MRKFLTVLAVTALLLSPVFSEEKADKDKEKRYQDIRKMLDASQATKMFEQMKGGIKASSAKLVKELNLEKDVELDEEIKKLKEEYLSKSYDLSMKLINMDEMINDMIPYYDKYLSNEDINAITAFYESPAGKRMIEANPKIMLEYMPKMYEKLGPKMKEKQAEIEKDTKEFTEKIKAIKDKKKKEKE